MSLMHLKIFLPFGVFADETGVSRIVAENSEGSFGILPQRRDCVAALAPGILIYEAPPRGEVFVAVNAGVLIKAGSEVRISVREAIRGTDLGQLRASVEKEFLDVDEQGQNVRRVMAKLEGGFLRQLWDFHR